MKKFKTLLFFLLPIIALESCFDVFAPQEKVIEITILSQKLDDEGKPYSDDIVGLLGTTKYKDCGDTTIKTTLKLLRLDLPNKMEAKLLEIPRSAMEDLLGANDDPEKIKDKMGSIKILKEFTEPNNQIDEVKLQSLIKQFGGEQNVIGYNIDNSFSAGEDGIKFYSDFKQVKQEILRRSCSSPSSKFLILYNLASNAQIDTTQNTENTNVVLSATQPADAFSKELQTALMSIIAKRSTGEKLQVAQQISDKFFNIECTVKSYQSLTNPNVFDHFGSKNGGEQYVRYLATATSLLDIQVQKVEKDIQTGKITALYVYEKHN
jgi:hypothetical protein